METSTLADLLLNSTDLHRILCSFGIRNQSECEDLDLDPAPEPKGTRPGVPLQTGGLPVQTGGPTTDRWAPSTDSVD